MFKSDDFKVSHNSRPPLRWIANWAGSIASSGIVKTTYMEEDEKTNTFKYKYYCFLWSTFWPIYHRWGTFYIMDIDMSGPEWDDYDENGIPYWDYDWHEDPETGDAWRIVKK